MANPRQRRKQKSSLPKIRNKSRPKLTDPKSNPLIAKNWNPKLTLSQNYRILGLTAKLNGRSGGTEKHGRSVAGADNLVSTRVDPLAITHNGIPGGVGGRRGKNGGGFTGEEVAVERNPKTGAIVRILEPGWGNDAAVGRGRVLDDPLNDLESSEDEHDDRDEGDDDGEKLVKTEFIQQLEASAANAAPAKKRSQSVKEQRWIEALVGKYGDDYGRMMRDRKMNVYQLSEGDIKARVKRWRAAGGGGSD